MITPSPQPILIITLLVLHCLQAKPKDEYNKGGLYMLEPLLLALNLLAYLAESYVWAAQPLLLPGQAQLSFLPVQAFRTLLWHPPIFMLLTSPWQGMIAMAIGPFLKNYVLKS